MRRIHSVGGGVRPGPGGAGRAGRRACRARSIFGRGPQHRLCLCAGRAGPGVRRRQMPARLRGGHGAPAGQQPGYAAGSLQYDGGHEPDHFCRGRVRRGGSVRGASGERGAVGGPAARPVPGRDAGKSCRHQGVGRLAHICVQRGCIAAGRYGGQNGHQLRRERRYAVSGLCLLVQRQ